MSVTSGGNCVGGGGVEIFFLSGGDSLLFFTVGHHTEQSVNKIKIKECLKFVL